MLWYLLQRERNEALTQIDPNQAGRVEYWLNINEEEINVYRYVDFLSVLQKKIRPSKKESHREFRGYMEAVEKLKQSNQVILYGVNSGDIYKAAFICANREVFSLS